MGCRLKFVTLYEVVREVIKIVFIILLVRFSHTSKYKSFVLVYGAFLLNAQ